MVSQATEDIQHRVVTGYGSWQHVINFQSSLDKGATAQGVHNFLLQFSYEYGVYGAAFALAYGGIIFYACGVLCHIASMDRIKFSNASLWSAQYTLAFAACGFMFGGLMGNARFSLGYSFGLAIYVVYLFSKSRAGRSFVIPRGIVPRGIAQKCNRYY